MDKNIKFRKNKITFKPLEHIDNNTYAYGKKQKYLPEEQHQNLIDLLPELRQWDQNSLVQDYLKNHYSLVPVDKEAFVYTMDESLKAKFEFSRIQIKDNNYISFCIEACNKDLVKNLAKLISVPSSPID